MRFLLLLCLLPFLAHASRDLLKNDAAGWHQCGPGSFEKTDDGYVAQGGMGLWWYSDEQFANAIIEFQFLTPSPEANSGIFLRFPDPKDDPYIAVRQGYELQIAGTEAGIKSTGAIYDIQTGNKPGHHIGHWNNCRVITAGNQIAWFINNDLVNIFETLPGRGEEKGYLGFQNHDADSPVKFRNVKVTDLGSDNLLEAFQELGYPRSLITHFHYKSNPSKEIPASAHVQGKDWFRLTDHGPAFFQTFGSYFKGQENPEAALKGAILSYSAIPEKKALFNTETLALMSATDQGSLLLNTPWAGSHGHVNRISNQDHFLFAIANPIVWADQNGTFTDNRPIKGHGNFPHLTLHGYFRYGSQIIWDYQVHGTRIFDTIEENGRNLIRRFEIAPREHNLTLRLSDDSSKERFLIKHAGSIGHLDKRDGSYFLTIKAAPKPSLLSLIYTAEDASPPSPTPLTPLINGGPGISPETFKVSPVLGSPTEPWAVDVIPPPPILGSSPYKNKLRLSDLDFFSDGDRALLSTWDGDIWLISGLRDFQDITWKRYATGFFEPLGLKIIDDIPYIGARDAIWKIHDLNGDQEADHFEIFNNDILITQNFHEFQFSLETDAQGNFYLAKGAPVLPGGRGFDKILPHNGTVIKISPDGKNLEVVATGIRAAGGLGVGPEGQITTGENEGTWQPCCKINYFRPASGKAFLGVENTRHGAPGTLTEPLCYLPMSVDNSSGAQIWTPENNQLGITPGELLHLSYGQSSIYHVLRQESADHLPQAAVTKLPVRLQSSAQRAAFHADGSLYVTGFRGWQTNAAKEMGLQRIRRNQDILKPIPSNWRVTPEGMVLSFETELEEELANDPTSFTAQRWKYIRSAQYGSGQFSIDSPDPEAEKAARKKESFTHRRRDQIAILSAQLLKDRKSVLIRLADHKPCMQFKLEYDLESADGDELIGEIHGTIHQIPDS